MTSPKDKNQKATTIRLTNEDAEIMHKLKKRLGLTQIGVLRLCMRRMVERLEQSDRDRSDQSAI